MVAHVLGSRKFLLTCENRKYGTCGSARARRKLHASGVLILHTQNSEEEASALANAMSPCRYCGGVVRVEEVELDAADVGPRR